MIGAWLKNTGKRHDIVLATKCRSQVGELPNDQGLSRRHIMDAVEASLRRLNTDYIDLYQTHHMDFETPIEETMRALDDLVHQGKVHYLGCSNYNAWRLCQALWASDRHSLARYLTGKFRGMDGVPDNTRASGNQAMAGYFTAENFKLIDMMEEIANAYGKTIGQVALAWLLTNPLITAPIVGARNAAQLEESIDAAGFRLSSEEMTRLNDLSEWRDE